MNIGKVFDGISDVKFLGVTEDGVVWFNDLYTKSTLAIYTQDLSRENIISRTIKSRQTFEKGRIK